MEYSTDVVEYSTMKDKLDELDTLLSHVQSEQLRNELENLIIEILIDLGEDQIKGIVSRDVPD